MEFVNLASAVSAWRGYEYYTGKKVKSYKQMRDSTFEGTVAGSGNNIYQVEINLEHPRSSKCNCPYADGKRVICKHMVAMYFSLFPKDAENYYSEMLKDEEEEEAYQDELAEALIAKVSRMKKASLQQALLQLLFDSPEWQYNRFIEENVGEYWDRMHS